MTTPLPENTTIAVVDLGYVGLPNTSQTHKHKTSRPVPRLEHSLHHPLQPARFGHSAGGIAHTIPIYRGNWRLTCQHHLA